MRRCGTISNTVTTIDGEASRLMVTGVRRIPSPVSTACHAR